MSVIKATYEDATTKVKERDSKAFNVKSRGASRLGSQPAAIHHRTGGFV